MIDFNMLGPDAEFEHVGLVVASIKNETGDKTAIYHDPVQKVKVAFVNLNGVRVELIEPATEDSPVLTSLKKGQKLVHLCYRVRDIDETIKFSRNNGFHCIAKPVPAVAFDEKRIAWLFSKVYGLVELVEK